ncbi:peptide deformylase [Candidatus Parcubacteria bacterium]|jgi:peptide deformylase|nr:peptide deformylase [Candidatus Parcubacteria bacterium]
MLKIAKYPDTILRKTAKPVAEFNDDLKKLADDMAQVMYQDDGVGLAAPQVSLGKRMFVVGLGDGRYKTYINPEITFYSKDKITNEEGCLSLPEIFGNVTRAKKIHIKYYDFDGKKNKEKLTNFDAIVAQHEFDHLNGILFIDRTEGKLKGQEILDEMKAKLNAAIK